MFLNFLSYMDNVSSGNEHRLMDFCNANFLLIFIKNASGEESPCPTKTTKKSQIISERQDRSNRVKLQSKTLMKHLKCVTVQSYCTLINCNCTRSHIAQIKDEQNLS